MSHPRDAQLQLTADTTDDLFTLRYSTQRDVNQTINVVINPPNETRQVTVPASQQYVGFDNTHYAATIALDTTTKYEGLYAKTGVLGASDIGIDLDENGNILNRVPIRDKDGHKVLYCENYEIFGLVHSDGTDGDAIAGANVQLSFAFIDKDGVLTATDLGSVERDIEFGVGYARRELNRSPISIIGLNDQRDAGKPIYERLIEFTSALPAAAVIDITDATVATAPVGTIPTAGHGSDTVTTLGDSALLFAENSDLQVYLNGVLQRKHSDVIWDSSTTFHFLDPIIIGDEVLIQTKSSKEGQKAVGLRLLPPVFP